MRSAGASARKVSSTDRASPSSAFACEGHLARAGEAHDARADVDGDVGDLVAARLGLAGVHTARIDVERAGLARQREGAPHGARRPSKVTNTPSPAVSTRRPRWAAIVEPRGVHVLKGVPAEWACTGLRRVSGPDDHSTKWLTFQKPGPIFNNMVERHVTRLDSVFRALGDATRRQMLRALAREERTVGELAEPFDISLAAASKHIKALENAGLIRREVRGRTHLCRLDPGPLASAHEWLSFYERFWTDRLDALDRLLRKEATIPKPKRR